MERQHQPWTKQEDKYLTKSYISPFVSLEDMIKHLHRTSRAITARAFKKKLYRPPKLFRGIVNNRK